MRAHGHPVVAALYDRLGRGQERRWLGARRRAVLAPARGVVLEIGAGTGANLPYYPAVEEVIAAEPDRFMRRRLLAKLPAAVPVRVIDAPAEALPLDDASVDTVVSTLALCTVADPARALSEARRVLRPGGRLLFLEHVRAPGRRGETQRRLTPLWRRMAAGCHLDRDTLGAIAAAGFEVEEARPVDEGHGMPLLHPIVAGRARPAESA